MSSGIQAAATPDDLRKVEGKAELIGDVDPEAETVAVYRADAPTTPTVYARGQVAEAGSAVPGWTMAVDAIFGP